MRTCLFSAAICFYLFCGGGMQAAQGPERSEGLEGPQAVQAAEGPQGQERPDGLEGGKDVQAAEEGLKGAQERQASQSREGPEGQEGLQTSQGQESTAQAEGSQASHKPHGRLSDAELLGRIKDSCNRAANLLIERQNEDGGYGPQMQGTSSVGITALVVWALAESPAQYREWHGPYISAAVDFLLAHQKENGGIHDGSLWNYNTSISIMALSAVNKEKYAEQIDRAVAFVKGHQLNEESRLAYSRERHVDYGGWGYGSTKRADLSNTQFALEVLHEAEVAEDDAVYKRVKVFLSRCQNSCDTNDAVVDGMIPGLGTNDDGGFIYRPGEGKVPPEKLRDGSLSYTSYGSMTYAGVKSYIYAHVDRTDKRVKKAYKWLCMNYTLDENPGMAVKGKPKSGLQGLYYYYRTMAKTLLVWGEGTIPARGEETSWARDLALKLFSLQREDGSWVNKEDRWWEGLPEISTSYAILALKDCKDAIKKWGS